MFLNKLKYYRIQKGMTLEKLAEKTGVSSGYLCHLEIGSRGNPSMDIMDKISAALDKTIAEVFFSGGADDGK